MQQENREVARWELSRPIITITLLTKKKKKEEMEEIKDLSLKNNYKFLWSVVFIFIDPRRNWNTLYIVNHKCLKNRLIILIN